MCHVQIPLILHVCIIAWRLYKDFGIGVQQLHSDCYSVRTMPAPGPCLVRDLGDIPLL